MCSNCNAFAFVHLNFWLIDWLVELSIPTQPDTQTILTQAENVAFPFDLRAWFDCIAFVTVMTARVAQCKRMNWTERFLAGSVQTRCPSSVKGFCDICSLSLLCCKWRHSSSTWLHASPTWYRCRISWRHQVCTDISLPSSNALNLALDQTSWQAVAKASELCTK